MSKRIKIRTESERYTGWEWAYFLRIEKNNKRLVVFKIGSNTYASIGISGWRGALEISLLFFSLHIFYGKEFAIGE